MSDYTDNLQTQGGLGKYVAEIMQRAGDRIPSQLDERDTAQRSYVDQLNQPIDNTPTDIQKYAAMAQAFSDNPAMPMTGLSKALQIFGQSTSAQDLEQRKRADLARMTAAKLAQEDVNSSINEMKSMSSLAKASGGNLTPEKLASVYNGARNEAAQIAKDYNFKSAAERSAWIEQQANIAVQNYVDRYSTGGGSYGVGRPPSQVGTAPDSPNPATPDANTPAPQTAEQPAPGAKVPPPVLRDRPEEARQKENATATEKMYLKDYEENVKPAGQAADSMLNTIATLKQIQFEPGMFAEWKGKLGAAMDALGMDGNMVRQAESVQQVRPLLSRIANDRLMMAKGTQTEGDAQRAYNEFMRITDTKKAIEFMIAWSEELANRAKMKDRLYQYGNKEKGTWSAGPELWNQTDYAATSPVAVLGGKTYSFSDWRDKFMRANPDADIRTAVNEWNKLTRGK